MIKCTASNDNGSANEFKALITNVFDTHVTVKLMRHMKDTTWTFPDIENIESVLVDGEEIMVKAMQLFGRNIWVWPTIEDLYVIESKTLRRFVLALNLLVPCELPSISFNC